MMLPAQNAVLAWVQLNCPATRPAQASKARLKANIADLGDIKKAMRIFSQSKYVRAASVLCTQGLWFQKLLFKGGVVDSPAK